MPPAPTHRVFLSHAPEDAPEMERLRAALAAIGMEGALSRDVDGDGAKDAIERADCFVCYLTPAAIGCEAMRREMDWARAAATGRAEYLRLHFARGISADEGSRLLGASASECVALLDDAAIEVLAEVLGWMLAQRPMDPNRLADALELLVPTIPVAYGLGFGFPISGRGGDRPRGGGNEVHVVDPTEIGVPRFGVDHGKIDVAGIPPDDPPPPQTGTYLNAWFPEVEGSGAPRLAIGQPTKLLVNLGPMRVPRAAVSDALAEEAITRLAEESHVDVAVLCPGAKVSPLRRRLSLPPDPNKVVEFTVLARVSGELTATLLLLIQNEPVHRSELTFVVIDPTEMGAMFGGSS